MKSHEGFSEDNDVMLMEAVQVDTCAERDKYVSILMDEMYIREDIVYEKHSGKMIGFANLGDVNNHLAIFEQRLKCTTANQSTMLSPDCLVAKTMMVFMVRGLLNKVQFPYAQFPCNQLTGDQLYDLFWEAVCRIETCGLKVTKTYFH